MYFEKRNINMRNNATKIIIRRNFKQHLKLRKRKENMEKLYGDV
jgi:hypothetical protein